MKEIVFGTTNEAKIRQIRGILALDGIIIKGLAETDMIDVIENGKSASENARIKAISYAKHLGRPVFSMDNALYLDGLASENQPGLFVRRIRGSESRSTDQQLIEYYASLVESLGGKIGGYWEYGMCLADQNGKFFEMVTKAPRIFVSIPSNVIQLGYPLNSIQIDPDSGRYMSELSQEEADISWKKNIGDPLLKFVASVEL